MRWDRVNGLAAVIFSLGLLLPAASALGQVINRNFVITDATDADTTGAANFTAASNSATAQTICRNGSNTVTVSGATTHPEFVRLVRNTARLDQGGRGNLVTVRVIGAVGQVFNVVLVCEEAAIRTFVNNAPNIGAGDFRLQAKNCTGLSDVRAAYLNDTCAADVDNTTLRMTIVGTTIERLRLRGRGNATTF